ncbi:MAG: right-handed parallel beta-helix repeat-containing protein [Sedimentisphaerales bacterium]|nr:right-handed parallel beta-helix repeat-containing protein [Sedimentisphaerales bacterium]
MKTLTTPTRILIACLGSVLFALFCRGETSPPDVPKAVPTFHCIGLYWNPQQGTVDNTCTVRYRSAGSDTWKAALPLWFDSRPPETFERLYPPDRYNVPAKKPLSLLNHSNQYRGSIVNLSPATKYEIDLRLEKTGQTARLTAETWSEQFRTTETASVPQNQNHTLVIDRSGAPDNYVLYTGKEPSTIDVAGKQDHCIEVRASYVIIRGLTLKNAASHAIRIFKPSHDVIIENCDISGWGRPDELEGEKWGYNMEAAVFASESGTFNPTISRIVIQRCRIHHPRYDTNAWSEYREKMDPKRTGKTWHPMGPQAVTFYDTAGNHVFRYNDIFSDKDHYYNDIIGGGHNFCALGAPNRDSDIYANILKNCWDDAIESEGANCNVRIWGNYISHSMVAIASAATHVGPLYIWRNVTEVSQKGPETLAGGPFLKAGLGSGFSGGRTYVFHNTILQPSTDAEREKWQGHALGLSTWGGALINHISRNNIWHVFENNGHSIQERGDLCRDNDYDYDLYSGRVIPANIHEKHGIKAAPTYDPKDPPNQHYLAPNSPGRDAGIIIPNFNDNHTGQAPDSGAYEPNTPPLQFGPNAYLTSPSHSTK